MSDYTLGETFYFAFTTRAFATGIPTTLAGTPVVSAYEDAGLTQITAGITLGVDHDSVGGLNMLTIVATGANGFEAGKDYNLVITTGTVATVSVVGEVVGRFTLGRSAAAVDLANGTDGLGAIKAETAQIVADTGTDGVVLANDAITAAKIAANAITSSELADGAITAAKIATDAITAAKIAANAITSSELADGAITAAKIATDAITAAKIAADAIGSSELATDAIGDAQIATGAIASTAFAAGAINAAAIATDAIGAAELASDAVNEIARAVGFQTNTALSNIPFLMVDSTDHVTPKTGLTVTGQRSIDGGAFANVGGTIAEVSNGIYQFDAAAADMNGALITFRFSGTAADDRFVTVQAVT